MHYRPHVNPGSDNVTRLMRVCACSRSRHRISNLRHTMVPCARECILIARGMNLRDERWEDGCWHSQRNETRDALSSAEIRARAPSARLSRSSTHKMGSYPWRSAKRMRIDSRRFCRPDFAWSAYVRVSICAIELWAPCVGKLVSRPAPLRCIQ